MKEMTKFYLDTQPDVYYEKISDRYKKGVPDIIACVNGIFVALELKRADGKPSEHQKEFIRRTRLKGGVGGTCYCLQDVENLLNEARSIR